MNTKLTMLGTGNALVTECYNWMDMRRIFVTHKHVDHLLSVVWRSA